MSRARSGNPAGGRGRAIPRAVGAAIAALALAIAAPAGADGSKIDGHLSFGYGRLCIAHATSGSIGVTGGLESPVNRLLAAGVDLGFYLYGNRNVERGSLSSTVDYNSFELIAFSHWNVPFGPLSRISVGPGLTHARAEISASAGGASFLDLAVNENAFTLATDLTWMSRKSAPVRPAFVAGWRTAFLQGEDWNQFSVRFGLHY